MPRPYQVRDKYFHQAKERGYRARSAFKLLDIQRKFKLIKKGDKVLDLGAAPGSFMQVLLSLVGPTGQVVGVDLQAIEPFDVSNALCLQGDAFDSEGLLKQLNERGLAPLDVVTSDMAPKTTGIRDVDQARSVELADQALFLSRSLLRPGGHFVVKVFEGADFQWLIRRVKKQFKTVKCFKPPSCRDRSFETYIVAMGKKAAKLRS